MVLEGGEIVRPGYVEDPNGVFFIEDRKYDIDYYYRKLPPLLYPTCVMPGITSSLCIPNDDLKDLTKFCHEVNYPSVCVPVEHFLWPLWTVEQKDFEIEEKVALMIEQRLMLELAQPFTEESIFVSGLELTSTVDCAQGYK